MSVNFIDPKQIRGGGASSGGSLPTPTGAGQVIMSIDASSSNYVATGQLTDHNSVQSLDIDNRFLTNNAGINTVSWSGTYPTAPTVSDSTDNSTNIATTAFVQSVTNGNVNAMAINSSGFSTNAGLADVPSLTLNVLAGKTYFFEAFGGTQADSVGGFLMGFGGTATYTSIAGTFTCTDVTNLSSFVIGFNTIAAVQNGLGGAGATQATPLELNGQFTVNAGGTITVQFGQSNPGNGSSSLEMGAYILLIRLN